METLNSISSMRSIAIAFHAKRWTEFRVFISTFIVRAQIRSCLIDPFASVKITSSTFIVEANRARIGNKDITVDFCNYIRRLCNIAVRIHAGKRYFIFCTN